MLLTALNYLGIAAFAASGALIGVRKRLDLFGVWTLAALTGVGGGVARDVLLAQVPLVLRAELYAVAALVGALVVALGHWLALPALPCALVGAGLCFGLRMMAVTYGWHLPVALQSGGDGEPPGPLT